MAPARRRDSANGLNGRESIGSNVVFEKGGRTTNSLRRFSTKYQNNISKQFSSVVKSIQSKFFALVFHNGYFLPNIIHYIKFKYIIPAVPIRIISSKNINT